MQRPITIAVEGNIAAGKSSLLAKLQSSGQAQVVVEPVDQWQAVLPDGQGNIMDLMYKDPKRWSYLFQSYVLLTMMEAHETPQTHPMRILERSVYSARFCFIENLHKSDPPKIDEVEYKIYQRWFNWLMDHHRPNVDLIVYLRTTPQVCLNRLKSRGRHEETDVPLSYLQTLHDRYEHWLIENPTQHGGNVPVLVLDGDRDALTEAEVYAEFAEAIHKAVQARHESPATPASPSPPSPVTAIAEPLTPESAQCSLVGDNGERSQTKGGAAAATAAPPPVMAAGRRTLFAPVQTAEQDSP